MILAPPFFCTFFLLFLFGNISKRFTSFVVYYYTNTPKDHYSLNRNTMITVENLSFTYRKSKRAVLHDFSLSFESGRVYGLLGKNGAGKSTLLYLMSGLLTPKNGKSGVSRYRCAPSVTGYFAGYVFSSRRI